MTTTLILMQRHDSVLFQILDLHNDITPRDRFYFGSIIFSLTSSNASIPLLICVIYTANHEIPEHLKKQQARIDIRGTLQSIEGMSSR